MFSISAFVRHFWLLWKERNQVFLVFLGVRLGIFLGIVVRFILRGCIFSWFPSLFSVSSSRSPLRPETPHSQSHAHTRLARGCFFHAGVHVRVCVCVCARPRRGLGVTPAAGMNGVSGRALQQAAAACSHYKPDSLSASKDYNWRTQHIVPSTIISSHYSYYLQALRPLSLSWGHGRNRREGNLKLTKGKHQKQTSISPPAALPMQEEVCRQLLTDRIPGIWLVWPVCALLLCGSLPCMWLSGSENIPPQA